MVVLLMLAGNNSLLDLGSRHTDTQTLIMVVAFVRIVIVAIVVTTLMDFILRKRLPMLFPRRSKRMQNHVILCGLGRVGYRVLLELEQFDTEVTVVEADTTGPFVTIATERGTPIVFADARNADVLVSAGLERARAVIAATDDDLTNVEIALDARDIRPDIRVVLRLFDQRLASKIVSSFDIDVAFSAPALAAPAFAAAAVDPSVEDTFYVGDVLFVHSAFWVPSDSSLPKRTVWEAWGEYEINTLKFTDKSGSEDWHPGPAKHFPSGCKVALVGPYEQVQRLQADHGIIDVKERVRHIDDRSSQPTGYMPQATYLDPGR